ncbi:MAG: sulfatase-like hydrolase/transferase [Bacteroidetes bacterium]|nr:sulfatase-like hydrolase/transferase [Bacteroidota bacterium]
MSDRPSISSIATSVLYRSHPYVMVNVFALFVLSVIRTYELIRVSGALPEGTSVFPLVLQIVRVDLLTWGPLLFVLTMLYLTLSQFFGDRAALRVHTILLSVIAAVSVGLSQYFSMTLVPLGADLFGYSWSDITETVTASGGLDLLAVGGIIMVIAVMLLLPWAARRLPSPRPMIVAFYIACAAAVPLRPLLMPASDAFGSETVHAVVQNKPAVFAESAGGYLWRVMTGGTGYSSDEYPLLRESEFIDVLGPFLTQRDARPNIVIIMIEGLGSAFVAGGNYSGFTPFLDSLAASNLYWKNMLSTTGRTFGVLPSLTASLPFGRQGFLELREGMPDHHSLFTLLRQNGYRTSYFYGGTIGFDQQDLFLERQGVDRIVSDKDFPPPYERSPQNKEGFTWGFADADLFRRSLEIIGTGSSAPRLDVYMTLSTHEPFLVPEADRYRALAERIAAAPDRTEEFRRRFSQHEEIFTALLYTDDALRSFFTAYRQRAEYANTIFIITGDHRLIPVPMESKIDRYRVPMIIASPMVSRPAVFASVSTHADLVPTLLGHLHQRYQLTFPPLQHWIGTAMDTASGFRNLRSRAFMPFKGEISDYIDGEYFLSGDRLFRLNTRLYAEEVSIDTLRDRLRSERDAFIRLNDIVTAHNRLLPSVNRPVGIPETVHDDSLFLVIDSWKRNTDQLYALARDTAFSGHYADARVICRKLLTIDADYHDVRLLMAGTYAWERRFEDARREYDEIVRRAPGYADAYFGLSRVEFWNGNNEQALRYIDRTIALMPRDPFAQVMKARIHFAMDRDSEALAELGGILRTPSSPAYAEAKELKEKYDSGSFR